MHLSIVTSMYNNSSHVEEFIKKCLQACKKLEINDYEIIIVDDFSKDDTYNKLNNLSKENTRIKIIRLYENCGQAFSLVTGFKHATGDYIFTLDSDLDENPDELVRFYNTMKLKNVDLVFGFLEDRKDVSINKFFSNLYYLITSKLKNNDKLGKYKNSCMRLFTKDVNQFFLKLKDQEIEILSFLERFDLSTIGIQISKKKESKSQYTFQKKFDIFLNFLMNDLSKKFLNSIFIFCVLMILFFIFLSSYHLINFIFFDIKSGYTSTILSIWLLGIIIIILQIFIINFIIRLKKLLEPDKYNKIKNKINF